MIYIFCKSILFSNFSKKFSAGKNACSEHNGLSQTLLAPATNFCMSKLAADLIQVSS